MFLLVLAHLGSPRVPDKKAIKQLCVCACIMLFRNLNEVTANLFCNLVKLLLTYYGVAR